MAEDSWMFNCGCGDGRAITHQDWQLDRSFLHYRSVAQQGVIYTTYPSYTGLLAPSNPGGNIVRIATGAALIFGAQYTNKNVLDFDVTGPGGGAQTDLIVIRYDIVNCTVRLAHKAGTPGGPAAVVQQDALYWEIAIASVYKAAGVNITTLTDLRTWVGASNKIVYFPFTEAYDTLFAAKKIRTLIGGLSLTQQNEVYGDFIVPEDYISGGKVSLISRYTVAVSPVSMDMQVDVTNPTNLAATTTYTGTMTAIPGAANMRKLTILTPAAQAGWLINVLFETNANSLPLVDGFAFEYLGWTK